MQNNACERCRAEYREPLERENTIARAVCEELMEAIERASMFISVSEIGGQKAYEAAIAAHDRASNFLTTNSPEVEK